ncbi:hypothetical protein [Stutzerimonas zhaodongensis]|uniref:hypothetical protein n=1 Tax=Stutzerimonas TaxID=2901164 RepID=UPI00388DA330
MSLLDLLVSARKGSLTTAITIALLIGLILQIDGLLQEPAIHLSGDAIDVRSTGPYATPD